MDHIRSFRKLIGVRTGQKSSQVRKEHGKRNTDERRLPNVSNARWN